MEKLRDTDELNEYDKVEFKKGSYISKKGYVLIKNALSKDELSFLKKELKGRPLQDDKYNYYNQKDSTFPLYIETKNKMYIPKIYGITRYGVPEKELSNYCGKQWENPIEFKGNLYPIQEEATGILLKELESENSGGILSLCTGQGKTISALYVLSKLKRKTLIIVNKIALLKQWEMEIKRFLPDTRIGIIQGKKNVSIENTDIVLGMLQSLAKIDYPDSFFEEFSVVCIDEIHNICSKVFSKVLMKLCCKYTVGLSATPKRSDGCEYIFRWFIGNVVYKSNAVRKGLPPIIKSIKINSSEYKEISSVNKVTGQKQILYTSMLNELVNMDKRNGLIIELIKDEIIKNNRRILVLSDRREHLKILYKLLDNDISVNFTYGLFIGSMKIEELERSKACQVILATYGCFSEGVSEKDLDTLILVTPKKFIGHLKNTSKNESGKLEQIVGRIFRKEHTEKRPMIIDFNDNFSIFKAQFSQRKVFYKQHFPSMVMEEYLINLDEHDNININYLKNTKTSNIGEELQELPNQITRYCLLED